MTAVETALIFKRTFETDRETRATCAMRVQRLSNLFDVRQSRALYKIAENFKLQNENQKICLKRNRMIE